MRFPGRVLVPVLIAIGCCSDPIVAATPRFSEVHREPLVPTKEVVLKKVLYLAGLMNAGYLGINDLVAGLQLTKKNGDPKTISAHLFAVRMGLEAKPEFMRHIARELRDVEDYPKFPLGFDDSPEGPQKLSVEFDQIAAHIEGLNIQFDSTDPVFLKKEADRVVFALFWTESEKIRTMFQDLLTFVRVELKEDLPFEIFTKPKPKPVRP